MELDICRNFCFFFKQKTAYDVRISDWSSDVCSSDLRWISCRFMLTCRISCRKLWQQGSQPDDASFQNPGPVAAPDHFRPPDHRDSAGPAERGRLDRKSVVMGKRVSVRVDLGGGGIIKKKIT